LGDVFEIARLLVGAGVPVRLAKNAVSELARGTIASVEVAVGRDSDLLEGLAKQGVAAGEVRQCSVNVKSLRDRLGVSQETFAIRYCIDIATLRNWEQERTKPDGPASTLLRLIDNDPEQIVELLAFGSPARWESINSVKVSPTIEMSFPLAAERYGHEELAMYMARMSHRQRLFNFAPAEV
jgi:DNA-binding transcriptional regulator YiaG